MNASLERFITAQQTAYTTALAELSRGRKTSHWMWFIFPQLAGLGRSEMARKFALDSLNEARAYLEHPTLGPRLVECTKMVNAVGDKTLTEIFGATDAMKFRSCMTLFRHAAVDPAPFSQALDQYCNGQEDPLTVALLK